MSKLLLLEDDVSLIDGLEYSLKKQDFEISIARTVGGALDLLRRGDSYDLLILDVTLPDGTGFEVCESVRRHGSQVPIIFLTASDEELNVIRGLDCGGDDYITKPFKLGELFSRIRALLRRAALSGGSVLTSGTAQAGGSAQSSGTAQSNGTTQSGGLAQSGGPTLPGKTTLPNLQNSTLAAGSLVCGDITVDLLGSRAYWNGKPLDLTAAEYWLLCLLVRNAGRIVTRSMILDELWDGTGDYVDDNTLSVYVRRLREKTEHNPSQPEHLKTVRGFGYQWNEVSV